MVTRMMTLMLIINDDDVVLLTIILFNYNVGVADIFFLFACLIVCLPISLFEWLWLCFCLWLLLLLLLSLLLLCCFVAFRNGAVSHLKTQLSLRFGKDAKEAAEMFAGTVGHGKDVEQGAVPEGAAFFLFYLVGLAKGIHKRGTQSTLFPLRDVGMLTARCVYTSQHEIYTYMYMYMLF